MIQVERPNETASVLSLLGDRVALTESMENLAAIYQTAKPFPHIVIDNMLREAMLDKLVEEIPSIRGNHWVHHDDEHVEKYGLRSAVELGETGSQLVAFLHSAAFLYFLSELTGIWQLLPDPYLQGAGYSLIPDGAKFDVHCDRNTAYETGLTRRLSLIIYLNKGWRHEYGGQLELWNMDGTHCESVIEPLFNRSVIFEIGDHNYHGIPVPIASPDGRSRNSFQVYYHTACPEGRNVSPHTSLYAPTIYQRKKSLLHRLIKELTPPILLRRLREVRSQRLY
jgi:2OG-Fe(II) oxygenase superfamily